MAFDDFDEYEQSEQLRKWLRENGLSIVIGVVLALALIFGWRQWQAHRGTHRAQAAEEYARLQSALSAAQDAEVRSITAVLEKDYADTTYAAFAAAARAELAVGQGKLDEAHTSLQWAVDHSSAAASGPWARLQRLLSWAGHDTDAAMHSLYLLRLARVELAQGKAQLALAGLDRVPAQDYRALVQELRGDAMLKLGRTDDARNAYTAALAALDPDAPQRDVLQMKLDDLAQPNLAQPGKQGT